VCGYDVVLHENQSRAGQALSNSVIADVLPEDPVIELVDYKAEGSDLLYQINVIKGTLPKKGGQCSLFIDIGMPRTPLSYAGVARRAAFRIGVF
jgi:hypothetical protein